MALFPLFPPVRSEWGRYRLKRQDTGSNHIPRRGVIDPLYLTSMRILHKIRKLRRMSVAEIRFRLHESIRVRHERRMYQRGTRCNVRESHGPIHSDVLIAATQSLVPGMQREELDRLERERPSTHEELAKVARGCGQAILSGDWEMLGCAFDLRNTVDWHQDPRSVYRWPHRFFADIDLRQHGNTAIDVKYVWELGRQQYLPELARTWLFTREERFGQRCRDLMSDWIESNPLYMGIHWTSALEVAMRAISWIWTVAALGQWDGWHGRDLERIAGSLVDHATYLERHFSFYSSPYNHLMGEATGLYLIGSVFRELPAARQWRQLARRTLCEHGPRQFYEDGFCVEQATGYHFFTLGFLSQVIVAARRQHEPLEELEPSVHRAFKAAAAIRQPDGRWPMIGDLDSARSIPVHPDDFWDFGSLCALGGVLFQDPLAKAASSGAGPETYWLLGNDGMIQSDELRSEQLPNTILLRDSGYAIARSNTDWLLFDAGPIAGGLHTDATPSAAHGHADTLQVLYCMGKRPVLIDPGIPFYCGPAEWVEYFRGSGSHNTLEVDGVSLARHAGRLSWSRVVARPCLDTKLSDNAWMARGRIQWSEEVIAERHLLALPGKGLWIADWIETDRPRTCRWNWLVASDVMLVGDDEHDPVAEAGQPVHLRACCESGPLALNVHTANDGSPVGWVATGYGKLTAGRRVHAESIVEGATLVVTFIGTEFVPFNVRLRGHEVGSPVSETRDPSDVAGPADRRAGCGDGEITWRIGNQAEQTIYCAGNDTFESAGDAGQLVGAGDWSIEYCPKTTD